MVPLGSACSVSLWKEVGRGMKTKQEEDVSQPEIRALTRSGVIASATPGTSPVPPDLGGCWQSLGSAKMIWMTERQFTHLLGLPKQVWETPTTHLKQISETTNEKHNFLSDQCSQIFLPLQGVQKAKCYQRGEAAHIKIFPTSMLFQRKRHHLFPPPPVIWKPPKSLQVRGNQLQSAN